MKASNVLLVAVIAGALNFSTGLRGDDAEGKDEGPHGGGHKANHNGSGGPGNKVTINHKGHIISVNSHALNAHLGHGDTIVSGGAVNSGVGNVAAVSGLVSQTGTTNQVASAHGVSAAHGHGKPAPALAPVRTGTTNEAASAQRDSKDGHGKGHGKRK